MKRAIAIMLALVMVLALGACGNSQPEARDRKSVV